jgi:hypothetical protein
LIASTAGGLVSRMQNQPQMEFPMDAWILAGLVLGLVLLDFLSLRYGSDSRPEYENPHDWS